MKKFVIAGGLGMTAKTMREMLTSEILTLLGVDCLECFVPNDDGRVLNVETNELVAYSNALFGAKFVYLVPSTDVNREKHLKLWLANSQAQLNVFISSIAACGTNTYAQAIRSLEDTATRSGKNVLILRSAPSLETFLAFREFLSEGFFAFPMAGASFAPISLFDLTRVALWSFQTTHLFERSTTLTVTGAYLVDGESLAADASKALDRHIRYFPMTLDETREFLLMKDLPEHTVNELLQLFEIIAENQLSFRASRLLDSFDTEATSPQDFFKANFKTLGEIIMHLEALIADLKAINK